MVNWREIEKEHDQYRAFAKSRFRGKSRVKIDKHAEVSIVWGCHWEDGKEIRRSGAWVQAAVWVDESDLKK